MSAQVYPGIEVGIRWIRDIDPGYAYCEAVVKYFGKEIGQARSSVIERGAGRSVYRDGASSAILMALGNAVEFIHQIARSQNELINQIEEMRDEYSG